MSQESAGSVGRHHPSVFAALIVSLVATALAAVLPVSALVTGPTLLGSGLALRRDAHTPASLILAIIGFLLLMAVGGTAVLLIAV